MLKPEYFTTHGDELNKLYQGLENFILRDIARRIMSAGKLTASADRQLYILQQSGESRAAIEKELAAITRQSREQLRKLLQAAVIATWETDAATYRAAGVLDTLTAPLDNPRVMELMDAMWKKSQGELTNLTRTTMNKTQQDLIDLLNQADMRTGSGAQSYAQAAAQVLDEYAGRGVTVAYPTGTKRTLEAAVLCCVRTAMNQTSAQISNAYLTDAGARYIIVSAHPGARVAREGQPELADHAGWQGKVYRIDGSEEEYPNLEDATGYRIENGQGIVVNPLGLHGYNCRHSHGAWFPGQKNPWRKADGSLIYDEEESKERYEHEQTLRGIERGIRKTKRAIIAKRVEMEGLPEAESAYLSKLQEDFDGLANSLIAQNKLYNDMCEKYDIQPQYSRNKVAGYSRADEKAVNKAYKRTHEQ